MCWVNFGVAPFISQLNMSQVFPILQFHILWQSNCLFLGPDITTYVSIYLSINPDLWEPSLTRSCACSLVTLIAVFAWGSFAIQITPVHNSSSVQSWWKTKYMIEGQTGCEWINRAEMWFFSSEGWELGWRIESNHAHECNYSVGEVITSHNITQCVEMWHTLLSLQWHCSKASSHFMLFSLVLSHISKQF